MSYGGVKMGYGFTDDGYNDPVRSSPNWNKLSKEHFEKLGFNSKKEMYDSVFSVLRKYIKKTYKVKVPKNFKYGSSFNTMIVSYVDVKVDSISTTFKGLYKNKNEILISIYKVKNSKSFYKGSVTLSRTESKWKIK